MSAQEQLDTLIADLYELLNPLGLCPDDDEAAEAIIVKGVKQLRDEVMRLRLDALSRTGVTTTVIASAWQSAEVCPSCGARVMAWGPTVGLWACTACKASFTTEQIQASAITSAGQ